MSSREEFEDWYSKAYPGGLSTGAMKLAFEELAYESWKASRQALVVELPEPFPLGDGYGQGLDPEDTREAIEAAGVRVRP